MSRYESPAPTHSPGDLVHGFRVDAVTELRDIHATCYECSHLGTGARLVHLHCDDEEKLYAIAFRTPPADSTGLPHILEHSVLCGSERYPVKGAFKELGKTSLSTFLNAFTYPDKTIYPACSAIRADYFNLASVYTDLVFHPLITERTFKQEGHHLEFEAEGDTSSALRISGVVYNEMKGAYSDPDSFTDRKLQNALFPDTCYGLSSGGDPELMPQLDYAAFKAFHGSYYSASNATWFLYGDIGLAENLAFIESKLAGMPRVDCDSRIAEQARWKEPRRADIVFPLGSGEETAKRSLVNVAWMLESQENPDRLMLLGVLAEALVGNAAGPLRKALVESGLGQDLSPQTGFATYLLQTAFTAGLRGTEPERAGEIEALVLATLSKLAREGIDPAIIEAAFHQIEFSGREISQSFPVELLVRAAGPANYGFDPKAALEFGSLVAKARARYAADPALFGGLIRQWLLDNPHRLLHVAKPSATLAAEMEAAFRGKMAALKASLSPAELERIKVEALALKREQESPDKPEAIATLPRLELAQIRRSASVIPCAEGSADGMATLEHPLFSNGVAYVDLAFDVSDLSEEEALWLPFLGKATTGLGAAGLGYAAMATRISAKTGGLSTELAGGRRLREGGTFQRLVLHGKAIGRNLGDLASIFHDILTSSDCADLGRIKDLAHEAHNRLFGAVMHRGHGFAMIRAGASLSLANRREEQWSGATQIRFLSTLAAQADRDAGLIASRIAGLQARIFTRDRLTVNLSGDPVLLEALRPEIARLLAALPPGRPGRPAEGGREVPTSIGVAIGAQVNYVAMALPVVDLLSPDAGAMDVLANLLSEEYLHTKLRVQGGAYGAYGFFNPRLGQLTMASYRDPRLAETFKVFSGAPDFLRSPEASDAMIDRMRVGIIGDDAIRSPGEAGMAALRRDFHGITDEDRSAIRESLFSVTIDDVRKRALPLFEAALKDAPRAAFGSREALEAANSKLDVPLAIETLE